MSEYDLIYYREAELAEYMEKARPSFTKDALCRGTIYQEIEDIRQVYHRSGLGEPLDISTTFFPSRGGASKVAKAKRICSGCPVRWECFEYGYEGREGAGIWGGSTVDQRDQFAQQELNAEEAFILLCCSDVSHSTEGANP